MPDVIKRWVRCRKDQATGRFDVKICDSSDPAALPVEISPITKETHFIFTPDYPNSSTDMRGFTLKIVPDPPSKDIELAATTSAAQSNVLTVVDHCSEYADINLQLTIVKPGNSVNSGKPTIRNRPARPPFVIPKVMMIGLAVLALLGVAWLVGHYWLGLF